MENSNTSVANLYVAFSCIVSHNFILLPMCKFVLDGSVVFLS